jgi:hypothetical protein
MNSYILLQNILKYYMPFYFLHGLKGGGYTLIRINRMVNYQDGKIYKIVCNVTGKVYIGSTTKLLAERLRGHCKDFQNYQDGKGHYVTSSIVLENNDYDIHLIENYPCKYKHELLIRERNFAETLDCVNVLCPIRSNGEAQKLWRLKNAEKTKKMDENTEKRQKIYGIRSLNVHVVVTSFKIISTDMKQAKNIRITLITNKHFIFFLIFSHTVI